MSGQTWPELSFRVLLRHIFRQQRFWSDLADKQPQQDQHACVLQFLGLAEAVFPAEYGELIRLQIKIEKLKARREQFADTLEDLARDVVPDEILRQGISAHSIKMAADELLSEIERLQGNRMIALDRAKSEVIDDVHAEIVNDLSERRAELLVELERLSVKRNAISERLESMRSYRRDLDAEHARLERAGDAGEILSDLRITHCPACDQTIAGSVQNDQQCFLCHQHLPEEPETKGSGAARLQFEVDRLAGECQEADELIMVLEQDSRVVEVEISRLKEGLQMLENQMAPARQAVSAFVQEEISAIDMSLGGLNERQRQLGRVSQAMGRAEEMDSDIVHLEDEMKPLKAEIDKVLAEVDFEEAATLLEDGMNEYLDRINELKPGVWPHNPININVSRWSSTIRIGRKVWSAALGGTDTLYFLMAYHYGLLSLSDKSGCHYPGLAIIDVPGDFLGEEIKDQENFIVQPFIELLERESFEGAQLIITGAAFTGLTGVNRISLTDIHVA